VIGFVWQYLDQHPGRRPSVGEVAEAFCRTERRFRAEWRREFSWARQMTVRRVISYAALTHALVRIQTGEKPLAAAVLAGFRTSYWNFNRQAKDYALYTCRDARCSATLQFDQQLIEALPTQLTFTVRLAAPGRQMWSTGCFTDDRERRREE
jgi:hypothetical protein